MTQFAKRCTQTASHGGNRHRPGEQSAELNRFRQGGKGMQQLHAVFRIVEKINPRQNDGQEGRSQAAADSSKAAPIATGIR